MSPRVSAVVIATLGMLVAAPWATADVTAPTLPTPPVAPLAPPAAGPRVGGWAAAETLTGVFRVKAGECAAGGVTSGSWFRMVQPGGSVDAGPFVQNGDSPCGDKTWTPLLPGDDGGLVTGSHQPHPNPAFDATNGGRATRITKPARFFGVNFATATNAIDPQTGTQAAAPSIAADGGSLSGDLRSFAAAWNGQHFNQGAPKPDGSRPGNTAGPTGTYDATTHAYTLQWSSQIVGGPFNNFTGVWRLEGTFAAAGSPAVAGAPGTTGSAAPAPGAAPATGSPRRSTAAATGSDGMPRTGGLPAGVLAPTLLAVGALGLAASRRAAAAGARDRAARP